MRILIRSNGKGKWKLAESVTLKAESELQRLLFESPQLINITEIREGILPLVYAIREFGLPGSGKTDLIGFTSEGDIALIECKLARNPEVRRKVIGQILEYAAYLWQMDYDEFDQRIQGKTGKSLANLIEDIVGEDWDEETFRNGIIDCLRNGSFILVIVVDEINNELMRIINYVNECSESTSFSLHALEINQFFVEKTNILVPHLYGVPAKTIKKQVLSQTQEEYSEFYSELVKGLQEKLPDMSLKEDNPRSYYTINTGIGSVHFEWGFHGRPRDSFTISLDMEKSDKKQNQAIFRKIAQLKSIIEEATGETVILIENWGTKWSRIYLEKREGKLTDELKKWAIEKMISFYKIIQPQLDELKI